MIFSPESLNLFKFFVVSLCLSSVCLKMTDKRLICHFFHHRNSNHLIKYVFPFSETWTFVTLTNTNPRLQSKGSDRLCKRSRSGFYGSAQETAGMKTRGWTLSAPAWLHSCWVHFSFTQQSCEERRRTDEENPLLLRQSVFLQQIETPDLQNICCRRD